MRQVNMSNATGNAAMKCHFVSSPEPQRRDSAMTPMIDVVFQLLAFFILTFRVVAPEGEFGVAMPSASPSSDSIPPIVEPLHVHLAADASGRLIDVQVNGNSIGPDVAALHRYVAKIVGVDGPTNLRTDVEVKLDCDPQLHYAHTMAALTAVSAYTDENGNPATLIERVHFTRPVRT